MTVLCLLVSDVPVYFLSSSWGVSSTGGFFFKLKTFISLHAPLPCSNTTCIVYKLHVVSFYTIYI